MHPGLKRIIKAAEQVNIRLLNKPTKRFYYESCKLAKSYEIISRQTPTPAQRPFEKVHLDLIEYEIGWGNKK